MKNLKSQPTQEITLRVGMEMFTAVILNMSTALWVMVRLALKQWKRLTYPPMNENGWTNSDYLIDSGSGSAGNNNSLLTMHSRVPFQDQIRRGLMLIITVY